MLLNRRRTLGAAAGALALAVAVIACGGSSGAAGAGAASPASAAGTSAPGGVARVALPAGARPDWIWPYTPSAHASETNLEGFQRLLYRPLYLFGDNGRSFTVNYQLSPASAPVYSDGGKTVTVTMKGWRWSDGEPVDASDVIFWLNMTRAEPSAFYGYARGAAPDVLASYAAAGPDTVVLHLKSAVSATWFTYDQLAEITPMPAAWDVPAAGAAPGSGGCSTDTARDGWARCAAVFRFLTAQAGDVAGYAASPLWKVVDGPWKLSSFSRAASGPVASFVPNPVYSGGQKPGLDGFTYYAYPGGSDEYLALKSGKLDVGYVPSQYLPPVSAGQALTASSPLGAGFTLSPAYSFAIQYLLINFDNPVLGAVFRQPYIRQALQDVVDQDGMIEAVNRGYGNPGSGGVPDKPANPWAPSIQYGNGGQGPYPFSFTAAVSLLTTRAAPVPVNHGWKEVGGVMTCVAPARCGQGIAAGTRLALTLDYPAGVPSAAQEAALLRSDAARAGIEVTLAARPVAALSAESARCRPAQRQCGWDLLDAGGWDFTRSGFEPLGASLFASGSELNIGGFSDRAEDSLIAQTRTSDSLVDFQAYASYTANELPVIWLPDFYTVDAVSGALAGFTSSPVGTFLPEYWYFTR